MRPRISSSPGRGAAALACCGVLRRRPAAAGAGEPFKITVQLDWVAEPEHGGIYQALAKGYFREAGLDVTVVQGGAERVRDAEGRDGQGGHRPVRQHQHAPRDSAGPALDPDRRRLPERPLCPDAPRGQPGEAIRGPGRQDHHGPARVGVPPLPEERSTTSASTSSRRTSRSANFIANPNFIQQGYYTAEPYYIVKGGAKYPKFLYAWDAGFDAYTALVANRPWAERNPGTVRAFMAAYIRGWKDYLEGDPAPANALMKRLNPNNTRRIPGVLAQDDRQGEARRRARREGRLETGRITRERIALQISQLEELGILPKGRLTVDQVMTTGIPPMKRTLAARRSPRSPSRDAASWISPPRATRPASSRARLNWRRRRCLPAMRR